MLAEKSIYAKVFIQEVRNIKGEIRHAATMSLVYLIDFSEDIVKYFQYLLKEYKVDDTIGIEYHIEDDRELIILIYDKNYKYNKESPKDIFQKRWNSELSEILLYKYYRMIGCSINKAREYAKKVIDRESSK